MFALFEPAALEDLAPRWATRVPEYPQVFGYSSFGHLFISNAAGDTLAILATERPELFPMEATSVEAFRQAVLVDEKMRDGFFQGEKHRAVASRLGPLGQNEVYFPVPYPALGGSGAPETYDKGSVWVYLEIYGQVVGI
ncbi:T6SS immunity protein Tdi1 domain-containing protein [Luteibacter yeojuensis]|uniref:T6SS immunity protein Tdi1 C-terminal domain-containing protein n=1 Tax=Luteibacter yeojuensis TaxID=345309 RepID=A0A0F3L106_9GAMM|nr:T6SS immunity protein Tdi1 domain-containing protein [Luteibacter yeojuensis]KJV37215.1 hypothetical protein VI08_01340 [Luteibacter yeojuensis]